MSTTIAVVQARMGSSRLPGKMLKKISGTPLIDYVFCRLTKATKPGGLLDQIILATSVNPENDPLVKHVSEVWPQVIIIRGSEEDVLSRFILAIEKTGATSVVRVTGDCPFINLDAMGKMIDALRSAGADVVNYQAGHEYVDKGLETISASALSRLAEDPYLTSQGSEHVTSLMYKHPSRYKVCYIESEPYLRRNDIRLTVDTVEDIQFFEALLPLLPKEIHNVKISEIITLLDQRPDIVALNTYAGRKSTKHERARLGFRCDGNTDIGLGHIVGSLRLAELLRRGLNIGAEFVVRRDPAALSLVKQTNIPVEVLPIDISPESDIRRIIEKVHESDWDGVVLNFSKTDLERYAPFFGLLKEAEICLIFMDNPLPPSCYLGDLLINSLPHPDYEGYTPQDLPHCYDGLEYFIPGFTRSESERVIKQQVERVLISMGGGDASNLTSLVIKGLSIAAFRGYVDVILGAACPHRNEVEREFNTSNLQGKISYNVSDMPERMSQADIGFSSLGLTTYEMGYSGLPTCIIANNEFNGHVAEAYSKRYGAARYIGSSPDVTPDMVANTFIKLMENLEERKRMSDAGRIIGQRNDVITPLIDNMLIR